MPDDRLRIGDGQTAWNGSGVLVPSMPIDTALITVDGVQLTSLLTGTGVTLSQGAADLIP